MAATGDLISVYSEEKSTVMKWLSKFFRGPTERTKRRQQARVTDVENLVPCELDDRSRADVEDSGHSNAPPSLNGNARKPDGDGFRNHADGDEELARAMQESLNMTPYLPYAQPQYLPSGYRVCENCNYEIGYEPYFSCMGVYWHPQCFCCHACGQPIYETEFSLSGRQPCHKLCYKEQHHPKCDVCYEFIPINNAGLIEYRSHPFWGQKYCPAHEHDNTPRCCSCERLGNIGTQYMSLGDGRSLCLKCLDSAIMDTGDCQSLYHAIRDYYEGMQMKIDQQIPMLLVERHALNEAMEGEKDGHHHMPETRGLCLSEEQTVSSIQRRPRIGGNRILNMKTHSQKLTRRCEVTAILVLYGLPRLLTGSILAHELMHGWLRIKGFRNLSTEVEEGICQVLAYMWLESEIGVRSTSVPSSSSNPSSSAFASSKKGRICKREKRLGEFFMHQIANDSSPVYGAGFRAANAAVNKHGLRRTLDHIRYTRNFPL